MFANPLRSILAAALLSTAVLSAAPASAQSVSAQFTVPGGQIEIRSGDHHRHHKHHYKRGHRSDRHFRHNRPHRRYYSAECRPWEAVRKAGHYGLRHAGIFRVSPRAIVVAGYYRGHRASLVFARHSAHCRVIGSRGI